MIVRCHVCQSDPIGRWRKPPMMIFIDRQQSTDDQYRCRDHVSPAKEAQLTSREMSIGLPPGGLR